MRILPFLRDGLRFGKQQFQPWQKASALLPICVVRLAAKHIFGVKAVFFRTDDNAYGRIIPGIIDFFPIMT